MGCFLFELELCVAVGIREEMNHGCVSVADVKDDDFR